MTEVSGLDPDYRARCCDLVAETVGIVGKDHVYDDNTTTLLHSYDASLEYGQPDLVVAPYDRDELRAVVAAVHRHRVPFVMRGAGTGYSGGALPARGGAVILTARLDRILETDFDSGFIRCEPGVVLASVHRIAGEAGWLYLPDPSSHQVCTIGGNVAENAGGPHALGGGPTSNYVSAIDLVRPDGSILTLDEQQPWEGGLDLRSVVVGSEGTLGAISSATLRLVRQPETTRVVLATFTHQQAALATVTDVFDLGLLPSAMDMLTGGFIPSRPDFVDLSLLFVGLQGRHEEVAAQTVQFRKCVARHGGACELLDVEQFLHRRAELVRDKVRRMVAASGCPRYYLFDAVAPRSNLEPLMSTIREAAEDFGLAVLNTFHAGDGNVHPTPFYDPTRADHRDQLRAFSNQILRQCNAMGGALSGEHGIGLEKQALMPEFFTPSVLSIMRRIKHGFDPENVCNPGKILPHESSPGPNPSRRSAKGVPQTSTPNGPRLNRVDALIEIRDPATTFADLDTVLAESPYELPYEPLGGVPDQSVLELIDAGVPGLREAGPAGARDLILGADLRRGGDDELMVCLGGIVAKDVAGYELRKLVYGGRRSLGVLCGARLRLVPHPSDSRLVETEQGPIDKAIDLCRRVHSADLPFCYLGVLLTSGGRAIVTGRIELRGGALDRHVTRLRAADPDACFTVTVGSRWNDTAMRTLAGDSPLTGLAGLPWDHTAQLKTLAEQQISAFASVGHRRTWWRGAPPERTAQSPLTAATVAAFGGTP